MIGPQTCPTQPRARAAHVPLQGLLAALEPALLILQGALAACSLYMLVLLLAARGGKSAGGDEARNYRAGAAADGTDKRLRLVVLVPAHDEEDGLGATLSSLAGVDYPSARFRTLVIADNCSDATAVRARQAGVETWERIAPGRRGKGHALAWALDRLVADAREFDAVVIIDADCSVSANLLSAIDSALREGASAAQVDCQVANPHASAAAALRYAAFALMNTVRPLGKRRLGLSCGLFGTGVALSSELLERVPWSTTGLAEDGEYHVRVVDAGERVEFIPDAWVRSAMPASLKASRDQQARWEGGRVQLVRRWSPRLLRSGIARRDLVRVHAGLEHLVPPQSLIAAGSIAVAGTGALAGSQRVSRMAVATLAAQLTYVLAGLRLVGAPAQVYRALAVAPLLMAEKTRLYARLLKRGAPNSWVRTERARDSVDLRAS